MAAAVARVGVPEICPVFELNEIPAGSAGLTDHDVTGEPEFVGRRLVIAVPTT